MDDNDNERLDQIGAAICQVMADAERVRKTGKNAFHNYAYASDDDLLSSLQPAMAMAGLALLPVGYEHEIVLAEPSKQGRAQWRTDLRATYLLLHSSGQSIRVESRGCGIDGEDKGVYKAMTGARKYALRMVFSVPTGDDAERDDRRARPESSRTSAARGPSPAPLVAQCRAAEERAAGAEHLRGKGGEIRRAAGAPERGAVSESWGEPALRRYVDELTRAIAAPQQRPTLASIIEASTAPAREEAETLSPSSPPPGAEPAPERDTRRKDMAAECAELERRAREIPAMRGLGGEIRENLGLPTRGRVDGKISLPLLTRYRDALTAEIERATKPDDDEREALIRLIREDEELIGEGDIIELREDAGLPVADDDCYADDIDRLRAYHAAVRRCLGL